jgi:FdhD protein
MRSTSPGVVRAEIVTVRDGQRSRQHDTLAVEEPMEVRVVTGGAFHNIAVTMRTPGHDFELAAGFLFGEGIIRERCQISRITYCTDPGKQQQHNIVNVQLAPDVPFDPQRFSRHVYTSSSCGVCGKTSLELVRAALPAAEARPPRFQPEDALLHSLPEKLAQAQVIFSKTGGLHAAALFGADGTLRVLREDVGRHNAVDKLVGALLLESALPATNAVLMVSGRASFELVQKALMAGIPAMAAVGAPSSLAVDLAREFGITLCGFLRAGRFNQYT